MPSRSPAPTSRTCRKHTEPNQRHRAIGCRRNRIAAHSHRWPFQKSFSSGCARARRTRFVWRAASSVLPCSSASGQPSPTPWEVSRGPKHRVDGTDGATGRAPLDALQRGPCHVAGACQFTCPDCDVSALGEHVCREGGSARDSNGTGSSRFIFRRNMFNALYLIRTALPSTQKHKPNLTYNKITTLPSPPSPTSVHTAGYPRIRTSMPPGLRRASSWRRRRACGCCPCRTADCRRRRNRKPCCAS